MLTQSDMSAHGLIVVKERTHTHTRLSAVYLVYALLYSVKIDLPKAIALVKVKPTDYGPTSLYL